jgi:aspartate oxidase
LKSTGLAVQRCLWETVGMAKKRTKLDRSQRQANQLEKRADIRPEQTPKNRKREDVNQSASRIVREITRDK